MLDKKTVTTFRGERIPIERASMSPKSITQGRKHLDVVIIETHCGIEIVQGIRAGIIKDAYCRGDYNKHIYHWPTKKGRKIENVVVLCHMQNGDYSIKKGLAAARVRNKTPMGLEIAFSYFAPKQKKTRRKKTKQTN